MYRTQFRYLRRLSGQLCLGIAGTLRVMYYREILGLRLCEGGNVVLFEVIRSEEVG